MHHIQNIVQKEQFKKTDITVKCPFCGCITLLRNIDKDAFTKYMNGELIQRVFPEMSANDRELLMTGMCKKCQDQIFLAY